MTSEEETAYYMKCAEKVAAWIGELSSMQVRFAFISNQNNDNGDPDMAAHECLEALGKLLGTLVCYHMETKAEIEERKENENGK